MKLKSITRSLGMASAFCLAMAAAPAQAALEFQGVTFTFTIIDANTLTLRIEDLLNADPDWDNVTQVGAIGIKGVGDFSAGSTITPDGSVATNDELNANACGTGGGPDAFCWEFDPLLAASNDMLFTIDLGAAIDLDDPDSIHLKVNFHNAAGEQIGSLLSLDVPLNGNGNGTSEPSILALFGLGLLLLGFMRRRTVV